MEHEIRRLTPPILGRMYSESSVLLLDLVAVLVTTRIRDLHRRRLVRELVTLLHVRGHHEAAHEVRIRLLPGVFPTKQELDTERFDSLRGRR